MMETVLRESGIEFLPTSPYEIVDGYNIEIYPNGDIPNGECEIWIPIKSKKDI